MVVTQTAIITTIKTTTTASVSFIDEPCSWKTKDNPTTEMSCTVVACGKCQQTTLL